MPKKVLKQLEAAKAEAQEKHSSVPAKIGDSEMPVMVFETGARGGYAFGFDTGVDGETWFVSNTEKRDVWGIRVSVKSLALALNGFAKVKQRLADVLKALGAEGCNAEGFFGNGLLESISRVDYCFDFLSDDASFRPDPDLLIANPHAIRTLHHEPTIEARGRQIETITIGKMPGRQLCLYNKSREMMVSRKFYWEEFWKLPEGHGGQVWRIEVRAGKDELRAWNVRRFEDLEGKVGNIIAAILEAIRYVEPNPTDSNRARWPVADFWQQAISTAKNGLSYVPGEVRTGKIVEGYRAQIAEGYMRQIVGLLPGLAFCMGYDVSEMPTVFDLVWQRVFEQAQKCPEKLQEKYDIARQKHNFLDTPLELLKENSYIRSGTSRVPERW
ncbi:MAG TPA: hypothetical protein DCW68_05175 [Rhodospirillaceae bacterium]|nr:MAG: hypothetical protein A2018_02475 [Alphaproteobacteria bacterium GWF2_58_20]HAU29488.1 hypothetical protein [Rhodospirillaceae bacterium]